MSNKQFDWPSDENLVNLYAKLGNDSQVARALGCSRSSLQYHRDANGISDACKEASATAKPAAKEFELPDATTGEGRKELRQAAELKFYKKEHDRLSRELVTQEGLFERFIDAAVASRPAPVFSSARSDGAKKRDVILHVSDIHYGECVVPEDVPNALETFNVDVIRTRADRYVKAVTNSMEDYAAGHTLENLVFAFGGDFVTGDEIFGGQEWQMDRHPVEQVLELADILVAMLEEILGVAYDSLGMHGASVLSVLGNHGAVGGRRGGARPNSYSWDYLLYKVVEKMVRGWRIDEYAVETGGSLFFGTKDHVGQLIHGDEVRGALSIPFYGIGRFDSRSIRMSNLVPDFMLMGHIHQRSEIPMGYGEVFTSGSWMAANNLARHVGAGPATQNMIVMSEEYGPAQRNTIHLQTRDERRKLPTIHQVGSD